MVNDKKTVTALKAPSMELDLIRLKLKKATAKTAPLWPLERFTAVNPYLGMVHQSFQETASQLDNLNAIKSTLPSSFYVEKINEGFIDASALETAADKIDFSFPELSFKELKEKVGSLDDEKQLQRVNTFSDVASNYFEKDWSRFLTDNIATWAAAFYDEGQAIWNYNDHTDNTFQHWKAEASIDKTTEIMGLKNFRKFIKSLPEDEALAVQKSLQVLEIAADEANNYFHSLSLKCIGWSSHAARLDWERKQRGEEEKEQLSILAILIVFEAAMFNSLKNEALLEEWTQTKKVLGAIDNRELTERKAYKLLLQEAFDIANQKKIISHINEHDRTADTERATAKYQAVFCIDVRSEIYRRHLEQANNDIETLGFAGFFGFPINYKEIGHTHRKPQAPVLLKPEINVADVGSSAKQNARIANERTAALQMGQVWKNFKSSAVSCFSFVSPLGLSVLPKLISDSLGWSRPQKNPKTAGLNKADKQELQIETDKAENENFGMDLDTQVALSYGALKTMSLTQDFAEVVAFIGHGANMTNNPHATAYDCGACGGHSGEANAKVAAAVLNKPSVRQALVKKGITIPEKTIFIAGLHDTTTDAVTLYHEHADKEQLNKITGFALSLHEASKKCREERALRFDGSKANIDRAILERSRDWSELRPEWGLAGCHTFIIAPRNLTKAINLSGKSFLHSYEPSQDADAATLEAIMTAPMVVTSWINLQYFASTVDNNHFGSGNKTLHNITSAIGVMEGYGGDLRVGLPEQAVHDGEHFQHEPNRLSVIINAPMDAITDIVEKHIHLKQLVENEWIFVKHMSNAGKITHELNSKNGWMSLV